MWWSHSRQPPRSQDSNLCTPAARFKLLTRDLSQPSCQGHRMPISQVRKVRALAQEAQNESQYRLSICFSPAALCLDQEAQVGAMQSALSQPGLVDARGVDKSTCREPWQTAHVTGRRTAGAGPGPTHAPLWASGSPRVEEAPDPGWAGDTPQSLTTGGSVLSRRAHTWPLTRSPGGTCHTLKHRPHPRV